MHLFIYGICRCLAKFGITLRSGFERDLIDSIADPLAVSGNEVNYRDFVSTVNERLRYAYYMHLLLYVWEAFVYMASVDVSTPATPTLPILSILT